MNHSGSWSLEISHNSLASIPSLAFSGLERALWRLVLSHNQFSRVPSDSISRLEKLNFLDLSGNNNFLEEVAGGLLKCSRQQQLRETWQQILRESNFLMAMAFPLKAINIQAISMKNVLMGMERLLYRVERCRECKQ